MCHYVKLILLKLYSKILTHEKIQDDHVHKIHQSGAIAVRWPLFDFVTVGWVLLPPDEELLISINVLHQR